MKKFLLLLSAAIFSIGQSGMGQVLVSRGQAELLDDPAHTVFNKSTRIPSGQIAKAGKNGVLLEFPEGTRARLAPGSEFQFGSGVPMNPVMSAPVEAPNATSAIKSILTRRDEQAFRNQSQRNVASDQVVLRTGSLIINGRGKTTHVRVLNTNISSDDAYYSVTMVTPDRARVTVAHGDVNLSSVNGFSQRIAEGEFAVLTNGDGCNVLAAGPRRVSGSDLAMADQAALELNLNGRLEPVAEMVGDCKELEPVGELITDPFLSLPTVGAGPSVPFDLANRILSEANPSNTHGIVQSPETP